MAYQEGLKRMIDRQLEQGKKEKDQQRKEVLELFGGASRLELTLSGQVKGVGFRAFVKHQADKLEICGWVKNTEDGVMLVVEGSKATLEQFLALCLKGPPGAYVGKHHARWSLATGEFSTVEIQR